MDDLGKENMEQGQDVSDYLESLNSKLDPKSDSVAIILAAGHGKRIKSEKSKMLHEIWGVPTVVRVANAAKDGLATGNQIIVVGIKACDVADVVGRNDERKFVFQQKQNGTGHAVLIALEAQNNNRCAGDIYIFPGDMGLLSDEAVRKFKADFLANPCDMMVLTGLYEGPAGENYYGRILRVPAKDIDGRDAGDDEGKVLEIKEHKDILALSDDEVYVQRYGDRSYGFNRDELLNLREFNTGVYAFKAGQLDKHIGGLDTDNVQGELYLTDLIRIFNTNGLTVKAAPAEDNRTVLGFNVKSVLKEMDNHARRVVYDRLKDIITIEDKDDFFIAQEVVEKIVQLDRTAAPLDIYIGKGAHIGPRVEINKGIRIHNNANITGRVVLGENVIIQENVNLSAYAHQVLRIGRGSEIFMGDFIKGNLEIGQNCRIESFVNMTGSDDHPTRIGNNVTVTGRTYILGCVVEDDLWIEHSVLKFKRVEKRLRRDGSIQRIRYIIPGPEGLDSIVDIN